MFGRGNRRAGLRPQLLNLVAHQPEAPSPLSSPGYIDAEIETHGQSTWLIRKLKAKSTSGSLDDVVYAVGVPHVAVRTHRNPSGACYRRHGRAQLGCGKFGDVTKSCYPTN